MTYVKTYLPTLKTHVVNLKRDAKDLSRNLQRLEVRGKLGSKTLYYQSPTAIPITSQPRPARPPPPGLTPPWALGSCVGAACKVAPD